MMTKSTHRALLLIGLSTTVLTLSACKREPTGQVAAIVNGDEITLQEVNAQLGNANLPEGVDAKEVQKLAVQRLIDRRLLSAAAKADGIEKSPDYLMRSRQATEALLVSMLNEKAGRTFQVPDNRAIDAFMEARPQTFAKRMIYTVDRIQFPIPKDLAKLKEFEADHSLDDVVARLKAQGTPFDRSSVNMDSAVVAPDVMGRILSLPANEPFLIPENGMVSAGVIRASRAAPLAGDQARPLAVQIMRNEALNKMLEDRLKALRASAKITYQPGFEPAGTKPAPAAK